ncbi:hypothetical protein TGMAS_268190 [Toxoplasma gondii MAS]|uniref:Uncharacterized protein n=1 Tax=Toxoplasma gondii MAS TaxID=943118 RepID=A0A086QWB4_TOXGO|nr:hypothetical protein TGMAS_268190 [Toxoplasma gondii MAS]
MIVQGSELFVPPLSPQHLPSQQDESPSQQFQRQPQGFVSATDIELGSNSVSGHALSTTELEGETAGLPVVKTGRYRHSDETENENLPETAVSKRFDGSAAANPMHTRDQTSTEQDVLIFESDEAVPNPYQDRIDASGAGPETIGKTSQTSGTAVNNADIVTAYAASCDGSAAPVQCPLFLQPIDGSEEIFGAVTKNNFGHPPVTGTQLSRTRREDEEQPGGVVFEKGDPREKHDNGVPRHETGNGYTLNNNGGSRERPSQPSNLGKVPLREEDRKGPPSPPSLLDASLPALGGQQREQKAATEAENTEPLMQPATLLAFSVVDGGQAECQLPVKFLESSGERREDTGSLL